MWQIGGNAVTETVIKRQKASFFRGGLTHHNPPKTTKKSRHARTAADLYPAPWCLLYDAFLS